MGYVKTSHFKRYISAPFRCSVNMPTVTPIVSTLCTIRNEGPRGAKRREVWGPYLPGGENSCYTWISKKIPKRECSGH